MAVHLEWHTSLPVLQATYQGALSANEYRAMCRQRSELLKGGPEQIVLVVNMQQMEGFPDSAAVERRENILLDNRVYRTLIVIPEDLYSRLSRAVLPDDDRLPVRFYSSIDRALDMAETLITSLS
jgi:hypothetical protein